MWLRENPVLIPLYRPLNGFGLSTQTLSTMKLMFYLPLLIIICTSLPSYLVVAFQQAASSSSSSIPKSIISSSVYKISPHHLHNQNKHHHRLPLLFAAEAVEDIDNTSTQTDNSNNKMMKILGICGGIGSGKSTACELMVDKLGCVARIDADKLAHCVYEPGSQSIRDIVEEFGKDILQSTSSSNSDTDGGSNNTVEIDRQKLGAIVFSDPKAMSKLERIVWPHVRAKIEDRIAEITSEYQSKSTMSENEIIIVEAALLLETDWHDLLDGLWVIQASPSVAVKRLMENRGLTEEEAMVRIKAQQKRRGFGSCAEGKDCLSDELRVEIDKGVVTAVVRNDGTLDELQEALGKTLSDTASLKR